MTCWILFFPFQRKQQQIERERLRRVRPPRSPTTVCYFWKPIYVCNNVLLLRAHRLQFSPNFQHHLQGFQSQIFLGWIDLPEWGSLMSLPARNTKHPTKCRSFRSLVRHHGSSLVLWGTKECVSMHHCGFPAIFGPLRVLAEKGFSDIMDWIWACEEQGGFGASPWFSCYFSFNGIFGLLSVLFVEKSISDIIDLWGTRRDFRPLRLLAEKSISWPDFDTHLFFDHCALTAWSRNRYHENR